MVYIDDIMVVRMRATRAHTGNRRSHHALDSVRVSVCSNCQSKHLRHTTCETCGHYRGKMIIDVKADIEKKAKKTKEKVVAR